MSRFVPSVLTAAAALGAMGAVSSLSAQTPISYGLEVGQHFPTTAFPALEDGRPSSITEFRGKKVVLHIFASW